MGLTKSKGNMYPWVTHTHANLGGECPHKCRYCILKAGGIEIREKHNLGRLL